MRKATHFHLRMIQNLGGSSSYNRCVKESQYARHSRRVVVIERDKFIYKEFSV